MFRKRPQWLNRNVLGLGGANFLSSLNVEMSTVLLPLFLSTILGDAAVVLGIVESVADGLSSWFNLVSGWYSDRIGQRKGLAVIGYFISAWSMACVALASNWYQVLIGRTLEWVGWYVRSPTGDALLVESTTPAKVGHAFAFIRGLAGLGSVIGPLIATLLLAVMEVRNILLLSILPGLGAVLALWGWVKEPKQREPIPYNTWKSVRELPRDFFKFLIPVSLFGLANFAPSLIVLRIQEMLTPSYGVAWAATLSAAFYTMSNLVYTVVCYPAGALVDRYSKKLILSLGYLLFAGVCFCFVFDPPGAWYFGFLSAVWGVYSGVVDSSEAPMASTLIEPKYLGTGYGLMGSVKGIGDFFSSATIGILWTFVSPEAAFGSAGVLALIAGVLLLLLRFPREQKANSMA